MAGSKAGTALPERWQLKLLHLEVKTRDPHQDPSHYSASSARKRAAHDHEATSWLRWYRGTPMHSPLGLILLSHIASYPQVRCLGASGSVVGGGPPRCPRATRYRAQPGSSPGSPGWENAWLSRCSEGSHDIAPLIRV
jgi:hypothetical protein